MANCPTQRSPRLRTLALGAATYGNSRMGTHHFPDSDCADLLRLRIYNVDYANHHGIAPGDPTVHLVAKGAPNDALGHSKHLDIFEPYWLDAAPR